MENEFINDLKCDLCGKPLTDTDYIGVVSHDETLCLHCFRHGEENNFGKIVEQHARIYSLEQQLKSAHKQSKREYKWGFEEGSKYNKSLRDDYVEKISKVLEDYYVLALKSESAASIELIKNLKEEINDIKY